MRKTIVLASLTCLLASCGPKPLKLYRIDFNTYAEWSSFYDRYKEIYPERYLVPKQDGNPVTYWFWYTSTESSLDEKSLFETEYENRLMNIAINLDDYEFCGSCYDVVGADISNIEMISFWYNDVWRIDVMASDRVLFKLYSEDFSEFPEDKEALERYKSLFAEWLTNGIEDIF